MGVALQLGPGMAGFIMAPRNEPGLEIPVAPNFEQFDGLTPLETPSVDLTDGGGTSDTIGTGWVYGFDIPGHYPRPGQTGTPVDQQTYTRAPIPALVNTLGGQPLAAAGVSDRIHRPAGTTQRVNEYNTQNRRGVGQAYQGVAQTVHLQDLVDNPPVPDGMSEILGGWG